MKLCPQCVTQLKPNKKKLGACSAWLVCPDCGYREKANTLERTVDFTPVRNAINGSNVFKDK